MIRRRLLVLISLAVIVAVSAAAAFGYAAGRVVQLHSGDAAIGAGVRCEVSVEGGVPEMLCSRSPRSSSRFDVAITSSSVIVYKMGAPDNPLFGRRFP